MVVEDLVRGSESQGLTRTVFEAVDNEGDIGVGNGIDGTSSEPALRAIAHGHGCEPVKNENTFPSPRSGHQHLSHAA